MPQDEVSSDRGSTRARSVAWPDVAMSAVLLAVLLVAAWMSLEFRVQARLLPLGVALLGAVIGTFDLVRTFRGHHAVSDEEAALSPLKLAKRDGQDSPAPPLLDGAAEERAAPAADERNIAKSMMPFLWIIVFTVLYVLVGAPLGTLLFGIVFLKLEGKVGWPLTLLISGLSGAGLYVLIEFIGMSAHNGIVLDMLGG